MIHFAIGTKAQFIKMAPVMHLLQQAHEPYHLLDLSQHGSLTGRILDDFGLQPITTHLGATGRSVETYWQAARWLAHGFSHALFQRRHVRRRWFLDADGVVLVHGDTLSTLLGLYLARAAKLKTGLVEAGLTSQHMFDPFPEEWIRWHASRRADYLFAPDAEAESRLAQRGVRGHIFSTHYNTGRDALQLVLDHATGTPAAAGGERYGIVTLHRLETLRSTSRLRRAIQHILKLAETLGALRFYLHPPTEHALKREHLYQVLTQSPHITLHGLAPYRDFVRALMGARFVLTDGGSIQEEAAYLNKPCLILRAHTERSDGLNRGAILSTWDNARDAEHLNRAATLLLAEPNFEQLYASRAILNALQTFRNQHAGH